jgi:filamentous hemagglutinin family protein
MRNKGLKRGRKMNQLKKFANKSGAKNALIYVLIYTLLFFQVIPLSTAMATPTGSTVVAGSATITPSGNTTNVAVGGNRTIINWQSLDTSSLETLQFTKPSGGFTVLNRVTVGGATQFDGTLLGNQGHIIIVNPSGIVFGHTAFVDAYKFTASTMDISNDNFMNGHYQYSGGGNGSITNYGQINAKDVALIGSSVLNAGTIRSSGGVVIMAAGDSIYLGEEGSNVVVKIDSVKLPGTGSVINEGTVEAPGGNIVLAAGDTFSRAVDGLSSLALSVNGGIGQVVQSGILDADSPTGNGGSITLTAADVVALGPDSVTTANAGTNGNGGEVIVYSHDTAIFAEGARIEAKGGSESGNGGFVEVSGQDVLVSGTADLRASAGQAGTFLLDPHNVQISDDPGSYYNVNVGWLQTQLGSGNFEVSTTGSGTGDGDIRVLDTINWASAFGLTLDADQDIRVNAGITNIGSGYLTLEADRHIYVDAPIALASGKFTATTYRGDILVHNNITAGSILLNAGDLSADDLGTSGEYAVIVDSGKNLKSTSGDLTVKAREDVMLGGDVIADNGSVFIYADSDWFGKGSLIADGLIDAAGNIDVRGRSVTLNGDVHSGGNMTIKGLEDLDLGYGGGIVDAKGTLTSDNGDISLMVKDTYRYQDCKGWHAGEESGYDPAGLIKLGDNVTAGGQSGDIKIYNNTEVAANKTLQAGQHIIFGNNGYPNVEGVSDGEADTLKGTSSLTLIAGADESVNYGKIYAKKTEISVTGSSLTLQQDLTIDTADFLFAKQAGTDLTLISDKGSVISTSGLNAADKWQSIGATANQNITLVGNGGSIKLGDSGTAGKSLYAINGDIDVTAGYNVQATKDLTAGNNLTINAKHGIDVQNVSSGRDMTLHADTDTRWGHDVVAHGVLDAGGTLDMEGTNIDIQNAHSQGDMDIYAHGLYDAGTSPEPMVGSGDIRVHGTLTTNDGHIKLTATEFGPGGSTTGPSFNNGSTVPYSSDGGTIDGTIYLHGNVTANGGYGSDVLLMSHTVASDNVKIESTGDDVVLAEGRMLEGLGALTVQAGDDILLGVNADNHWVNPEVGSAGNVSTAGNLILNAGDDVYAHGNLIAGGNIEVYSSDSTTYLYGDLAQATGSVLLNNNTELRGASNQSITAQNGTVLANGTLAKTTSGQMSVLAADGITLSGATSAMDSMYLDADRDEDGIGDMLAQGTLTTTNGNIDISASDTTIKLQDNVSAGEDLILNNNTEVAAGKELQAGQDVSLAGGKTMTGFGDLTVRAERNIDLGGDVTAAGNLTISANPTSGSSNVTADGKLTSGGDMLVEAGDSVYLEATPDSAYAGGDMTITAGADVTAQGNLNAGHDITISSSDNTTYLGGNVTAGHDVTLNNNTRFTGMSDQQVEAGGMITAGGWLDKLNAESDGSLYLHAGSDIMLADDVTAAICCPEMCWSAGGGVSIISDNGAIYTPGVEVDGKPALAINITGRSDHFGGIGVDLPYGQGKAAIVIQSQEDLVLDETSSLTACGRYYEPELIGGYWTVDDRPGVDFLDVPQNIPAGGSLRNQGEPFDAAIYVGSKAGDVHIGAEVDIRSREPVDDTIYQEGERISYQPVYACERRGAMIADARDTVTFGENFKSSLENGRVGDRLEVCSRITEWLEDAITFERLPYADNFKEKSTEWYGNEDSYVLRGAGEENPDIGEGSPAWVLESKEKVEPFTAVAPIQQQQLKSTGCPALTSWVAKELGVESDQIQIYMEGTLALGDSVQPCQVCAQLKNSALVLMDADGSQMKALAGVVNEFAGGGAPPSEEQMAMIATAMHNPQEGSQYALAAQWLDALTEYVNILNKDLKLPMDESLAFAGKYTSPAVNSGNVALAAYVQARLTAIGG